MEIKCFKYNIYRNELNLPAKTISISFLFTDIFKKNVIFFRIGQTEIFNDKNSLKFSF